jgi:hypothetical protein
MRERLRGFFLLLTIRQGISFHTTNRMATPEPYNLSMNKEKMVLELSKRIGGLEAAKLRRETALATARDFVLAALAFAEIGDSSEKTQKADKDVYAFSIIIGMAGELAIACAELLSTGQHYAGAALLRQMVEIEYLTWNFKEGRRDPSAWLESTSEERREFYTPAKLRKDSAGRFLAQDYGDHCENGGHPVPPGASFLRAGNPAGAQLFLVDLIMHLWRTWDNTVRWGSSIEEFNRLLDILSSKIYQPLTQWGEQDKVYELAVQQMPAR